jgi:hypothetical protein
MREFSKPPSRAQQRLAIALGLLAMAGFSCLAAVFWSYAHAPLVASVFALLFLGSSWLFFRALLTAHRSLGRRETSALAWAFVGLGLVSIAISLLVPGFSVHKLMLLGPGLSMLGAGLAGVLGRRP